MAPTHWQRIVAPHSMKALRPVASKGFENLYASATAKAVEGNLGGFCVWAAKPPKVFKHRDKIRRVAWTGGQPAETIGPRCLLRPRCERLCSPRTDD